MRPAPPPSRAGPTRSKCRSTPRRGFRAAFKAVQPRVDEAAGISRRTGHPLFITGHSLGAALAALAGQHADTTGAAPRAVYVFGMPRAGGEKFQMDYNIRLGPITYRLHRAVLVHLARSSKFSHSRFGIICRIAISSPSERRLLRPRRSEKLGAARARTIAPARGRTESVRALRALASLLNPSSPRPMRKRTRS